MFGTYERNVASVSEVDERIIEGHRWFGQSDECCSSRVLGTYLKVCGANIFVPPGWRVKTEASDGCTSVTFSPSSWAALHRYNAIKDAEGFKPTDDTDVKKSLEKGLSGRYVRLTVEDRSGLPVFRSAAEHAAGVIDQFVNSARSAYLAQRRQPWESFAPCILCWKSFEGNQEFNELPSNPFPFTDDDFVVVPRSGVSKDFHTSVREVSATSALESLKPVLTANGERIPSLEGVNHMVSLSIRQSDGRRHAYSFLISYAGARSFVLTFQSSLAAHRVLDVTEWDIDWMGAWLDIGVSIGACSEEAVVAEDTTSDDDLPPLIGATPVPLLFSQVKLSDVLQVQTATYHCVLAPIARSEGERVPPMGDISNLGGIERVVLCTCSLQVPTSWRRFDEAFLPLLRMEGIASPCFAQFVVNSHELGHPFAIFFLVGRGDTLGDFVLSERTVNIVNVATSVDELALYSYTLGIRGRSIPGPRSAAIHRVGDATLALVAVPLLPSSTHDTVPVEVMPHTALAAALLSATPPTNEEVSVLKVPTLSALTQLHSLTETKVKKLKGHLRDFRQVNANGEIKKSPPTFGLQLGSWRLNLPSGWGGGSTTTGEKFCHVSNLIHSDWELLAAPPSSIVDARTHVSPSFVGDGGLGSVERSECWLTGQHPGVSVAVGQMGIFSAEEMTLAELMELCRGSLVESELDRSGVACSLSLLGEVATVDECVKFCCRVQGSNSVAYLWGTSRGPRSFAMFVVAFSQQSFAAMRKVLESVVIPSANVE